MVNFLQEIKGANILTMIGVLVIFVAAFLVLDKGCVVPNAKAMFKENFSHTPVSCYIQRPDIIREIEYILRPPSTDFDDVHPGGYFLLEGPHGCGKTTILHHAVAHSGPGILYVSVGVNGDVGASLQKALKIDTYWGASIRSYINLPLTICPDNSLARLESALEILIQVTIEIFEKDKYPPTVVFDNLPQILTKPEGIEAVGLLQDVAKEMSDNRWLIVLFSSSESGVTNLMKSRSSASRLIHTVKVGDLTDKQAFDYLTCRCHNASKDEIADAVRLVGGRVVDLVTAARTMNARDMKMTLEQQLLKAREGLLQKSLMTSLPKRVRTVLYEIAHSLINSPSGKIAMSAYDSLVKELDEGDLKLIEATNVFSIESKEVTFHSRLTKRYFEDLLHNSTAG